MKHWALVALMLASFPALADVSGVAVVTDGDTIRIGEAKIRLFGIDAPEGKQSCERDGVSWLCGQESGAYLRKLIGSDSIACAERSKDRYGRIVATCKFADGRDIGAEMVSSGLALAYRRYGGKIYDAAEMEAKSAKRGLWAGEFIPPWEWRKGR